MRFSVLLLAPAFFLSSCHYFMGERISGNGHVVSQQKNVGTFNSIDASGQVTVHVRQDASASVKIETDENLQSYLDVFTDGSTLVIRTKQGFHLDPSKDIIAYISAPVFRNIELSGQCDIIGDSPVSGNEPLSLHVSGQGEINLEVHVPKISTDISGQGTVSLKGQVTDFNASVSGQGDVKCFDLITENTTLDISGGSDVEVTANKQLNIEASGSTSVQYKGNANVNQSISGSGSVKKVG
jgi:Putative auto-transporter adhesin, head GIN domain